MHALADFASKWSHPDDAPKPILPADLERAETQLGGRLPDEYRAALLNVGLPQPTGALLHSICEAEADFADVSDFFTADQMIESTRDWREMGLPNDKTAFASDCMGNLFAFDGSGKTQGSEVWFFDHDIGQTSLAAPSFAHWIQQFLELKFVPLED